MKTIGILVSLVCFCLMFSSCPAPSTGPATVFSDNFSGYTTFPVIPWATVENPALEWSIVSGAAYFANVSLDRSCLLYTGWFSAADCSVSADLRINIPNEGLMEVAARVTGDQTTLNAYLFAINVQNEQFALLKGVAGSGTVLAGPFNFPAGGFDTTVYHTYRLTVSGATLTGSVDGVQWITATDPGPVLGAGNSGIVFGMGEQCYLDNFLLTTP